MAEGTKYIYEAIKDAIFKSAGITRKEIADQTGLDIRTVTAHAGKLVNSGQVRMEFISDGRRGRPTLYYTPIAEDQYFMGMLLEIDHISYILTSYPGRNIVKSDIIRVPLLSKSSTGGRKQVAKIVGELIRKYRHLNISGIGFCLSRWLRPPFSEFDHYNEAFVEEIRQQFFISASQGNSVGVYSFKVKELFPHLNRIALIHLGNQLELGALLDGEIPENMPELEEAFRHIQVGVGGGQCGCGKKCCLAGQVTKSAVTEKLAAGGNKMHFNEFREALLKRQEPVLPVARETGKLLGKALVKLTKQYRLEAVILKDSPDALAEFTRDSYLAAGGDPGLLLQSVYMYENDLLFAAAAMAHHQHRKNSASDDSGVHSIPGKPHIKIKSSQVKPFPENEGILQK